jgi:hypothetical protein
VIGRYQISGGAVVLTPVKGDVKSEAQQLYDIHIYLPQQSQRDFVFSGSFPSDSELISRHGVSSIRQSGNFSVDFAGQKLFTTVSATSFLTSLGPSQMM